MESPTSPDGHAFDLALAAVGRGLGLAARRLADGLVVTGHAERADDLWTGIERLAGSLDASPTDLRTLSVDRGPGSYTGLRTVLTCARTLAEFAGTRVRACTSFEWIAAGYWHADAASADRPVRVLLDARRQRLHTARVERDAEGRAHLTDAPAALDVETLRSRLRADELLLVPADDPPLPEDVVRALDAGVLHRAPRRGLALGVAAVDTIAWRHVEPDDADAWQPLYLMGTYADAPP